MGEWIGVSIALLSSSLGGTAAAITRYLVVGADPIVLAILRWGIGFLCLLPAALLLNVRWPERRTTTCWWLHWRQSQSLPPESSPGSCSSKVRS